jgi:hypothetical protein
MDAGGGSVRTRRSAAAAVLLAWFAVSPSVAHAQATPALPPDPVGAALPSGQAGHQHEAPPQDHSHHGAAGMMMFQPREASGTAWLPDDTPMYGIHRQAGPWQLMGHGNAFAQYLRETGDRGSDQIGSINWIMGMARRDLGAGRFGVRGMVSLEPWSIRGCGYPDLLATGEICDGGTIHDRQHPHDLFMEVAAEYDRPLSGAVRWRVYGGPAGEPALGPVAYPHRLSAAPNPLAPISHHWLDATHITFGVVTGAVYDRRWKVEASVFNGREPDENRRGFDFQALDSMSGRLWFMPTSTVALQVSAGHLQEAESDHESAGRVDVDRMTASVTYHRPLGADSIWATTLAWGRNSEQGASTNALLGETNVTRRERDAWFGRFEIAAKSAHDLDIHGTDEVFTVGKVQVGYTRYIDAWKRLKPGFGGGMSAGFVPRALEPAYGSRVNLGVGVFVTVRPEAHRLP